MRTTGIVDLKQRCISRFTGIAACVSVVFALVLGAGIGTAAAGSVVLAWDANTEPDVSGYKLYYGTATGTYGTPTDVGNVLTYTVLNLTDGQTYYFAVTAYDTFGNESGYSNEVVYTVPGVPEINLVGNSVSIVDGDTTPSTTDFTNFGSADVTAGTVTRTFTIQNTGTGALTLSGTPLVAVSGTNAADFTVTVQPASSGRGGREHDLPGHLRPERGRDARRHAHRSPTTTPTKTPTTSPSRAPAPPPPRSTWSATQSRSSTATPRPRRPTSPTSAAPRLAGGIVTRTFTIQNTGTAAALSVTTPIAISGANAADFSVTAQPAASVAAAGSTTFTGLFDPSAAGTRGATLTITNNDTDENPYNFSIQGRGVAPPAAPGNVRHTS